MTRIQQRPRRWLPVEASGHLASPKWIPWIPQKNPARPDRDSASLW